MKLWPRITVKYHHLETILRCQSLRIRIISSRPELLHNIETVTGLRWGIAGARAFSSSSIYAATAAVMAAIIPLLFFNSSFAQTSLHRDIPVLLWGSSFSFSD